MGWVDAQLVPAVDGVAYGLLLFTLAAGLTLVFGTGRVLNLAHGTLYAAGAYVAASLGDGSWAGLALAVGAATLVGAATGGLLAGLTLPVARSGHLAQALLTFGVALVGGDLLTTAFGAQQLAVPVPAALDRTVTLLGHRYPLYRLAFIVVAVTLALAGRAVATRTRAGLLVRAVADEPGMVSFLGVSPRRVHAAVLVTAGALAAAAGALGAPIIGPAPGTADTVLLLSLVVVVVGRPGSVGGALVAAMAVGEVQTLGVTLFPGWAPYLLLAAMAAALVLRSVRTDPLGERS